ncbi:MAG: hypothetical protein KGQ37_01205 [Hyphomicrobiales bacterium]|nr:hypothetical protein [Hyphomicrobiales bacterium]
MASAPGLATKQDLKADACPPDLCAPGARQQRDVVTTPSHDFARRRKDRDQARVAARPAAGPRQRSGRAWTLHDAAALCATFNAAGQPVPIDWEHAQDIVAVNGGEAPASGWNERHEHDMADVWARVAWTERGAKSVASREGRLISPAFLHTRDGAISRLVGAALVNRPALELPSVTREDQKTMDKELLKVLGLPETATVAEATAVVEPASSARARPGQPASRLELVIQAEADVGEAGAGAHRRCRAAELGRGAEAGV